MALQHLTFAEIRGQDKAKRALEIAAAGGHHIALVGPRGCGKSALAIAYSNYVDAVWGEPSDQLPRRPAPLVATAPPSGISRGPQSLTEYIDKIESGLLILDDIDRIKPEHLSAVRGCIDSAALQQVTGSSRLPLSQLIATLSVCPCGYGDSGFRPCARGRACLVRHQWYALRWFMDVLDLQVELQNTTANDWLSPRHEIEPSTPRIAGARRQQQLRGICNADIDGELLHQVCCLHVDAKALLDAAIQAQEMTGRDCAAVIRVARTVADMEASVSIRRIHMAEALIYRLPRPLFRHYLDRKRESSNPST